MTFVSIRYDDHQNAAFHFPYIHKFVKEGEEVFMRQHLKVNN